MRPRLASSRSYLHWTRAKTRSQLRVTQLRTLCWTIEQVWTCCPEWITTVLRNSWAFDEGKYVGVGVLGDQPPSRVLPLHPPGIPGNELRTHVDALGSNSLDGDISLFICFLILVLM